MDKCSAEIPNDRTPEQEAEQAWTLLQKPDVMAGIFRRQWTRKQAEIAARNLLAAWDGKTSEHLAALGILYKRLKPLILSRFEEVQEGQRFLLKEKVSQ